MSIKEFPCGDSREVAVALRALLMRALAGQVRGVSIDFQDGDGSDRSIRAGVYRRDPEAVLRAAVRRSWEAAIELPPKPSRRRRKA